VKGIEIDSLLLRFNVSHIDDTFEGAGADCLLIVREITSHDARATLFVLEDGLGQITSIPKAKHVVRASCGNLSASIVCDCAIESSRVFLQCRCAFSGGNIPDLRGSIGGSGDQALTVGHVVETPDALRVTLECLDAFSICVPRFDGSIMGS